MCMGFSGNIFTELKPGDEVIVGVGYGYPKRKKDFKCIIAKVSGHSALTTTGVKLSCFDEVGIKTTGNYQENFEVTPRARRILEKAGRL